MTGPGGVPSTRSGRPGRPADLDVSRAWIVDPESGREGPGELVVRGGILEALTWLDGRGAAGIDDRGVIATPGFVDLHAHVREPGNAAAETIASGLAAAAHGGFTTVCAMPNTTPPVDGPAAVQAFRARVAASGSPVRALPYGAATAGRAGEQLAALSGLAAAGVAGFTDDGSPIHAAPILASLLAYAGMLGLPVIDHPEDPSLTAGAEANEGVVATVLGLRGWPAAAEVGAVARDLAILADVVRDEPRARLHLTHLSVAGSFELVRAARAAGLPVTCDVTPHHLALTDEWIAGARRLAWQALGGAGSGDPSSTGDPWSSGAIVAEPYDTSLRVNPPLRTPADAEACAAALRDGIADAIATDHAPHSAVDKDVEFGLAANGISGIETALGLVLELVDAGRLSLATAIAALTTGPARVLGGEAGAPDGIGGAARPPLGRLVVGAPADLVVFDRSARWTVTRDALLSRGKHSPLLGRDLPGQVLLTLAGGHVALEAPPT